MLVALLATHMHIHLPLKQVLSKVIGVAELPLDRRSTANSLDQALTQLQASEGGIECVLAC